MSTHSVHQFAEKVAVISDGTNPIARAVALQLGLLGCFVIVGSSQDSPQNTRALEELRSLGTLAASVETDLSTPNGAKTLIDEAERTFGRVDLLVNCPNFAAPTAFAESTETDFDAAISVDLKSVYFITQTALGLMNERPKPKIVNVVSGSAETLRNPLFAASQAGIKAFTRSLAATLPAKFRVNCVSIDAEEPAGSAGSDELFRPAGSLSPDAAARTIVYLLTSEAIGVNGQVIGVR